MIIIHETNNNSLKDKIAVNRDKQTSKDKMHSSKQGLKFNRKRRLRGKYLLLNLLSLNLWVRTNAHL